MFMSETLRDFISIRVWCVRPVQRKLVNGLGEVEETLCSKTQTSEIEGKRGNREGEACLEEGGMRVRL